MERANLRLYLGSLRSIAGDDTMDPVEQACSLDEPVDALLLRESGDFPISRVTCNALLQTYLAHAPYSAMTRAPRWRKGSARLRSGSARSQRSDAHSSA